MVGLIVTGWSTLLVVLVGWRLSIGTSSLRRVSRRSLLLLALLLVSLLLAVACLLGLVARLLLAICRRLGVATLAVTSWLAVGIVTERQSKTNTVSKERSVVVKFTFHLVHDQWVLTSVVQLEQPAGHIQGRQTGQYTLAESHKTGRQLEQQRLECSHNHWLHNPGLTGSSCGS